MTAPARLDVLLAAHEAESADARRRAALSRRLREEAAQRADSPEGVREQAAALLARLPLESPQRILERRRELEKR